MAQLLMVLWMSAAPAQVPVTGILPAGAISIESEPEAVVTGQTLKTVLTIRCYRADGGVEDQAPPTLLASLGSIEEIQRVAPGVFRASYIPPRAGPPRVVIILARLRTRAGLMAGWTRVPLWGQGQVTVVTKPESQVWLRIGDDAFGPVESDKKGRATLQIQVPPGPRHGVAETLDRAGNRSKKNIDLGVSAFNRMAAFALDETVVADGSEQSGLIGFVVDGRGVPMVDAGIVAKAQRGSIGQIVALAPGVYRIAYQAPTTLGRGKDRVRLSLKHHKASWVKLDIALSAGDPARIVLSLSAETFVAGQADMPTLRVSAFDKAGNATSASLVDVETDGAVLGAATTSKPLEFTYPIELSPRFAGRREVVVRARARRSGAETELRISLKPGPCVELLLQGPARLIADESQATYRLRCPDAFGNSTRMQAPTLETGLLSLVSASLTEDGYAAELRVRSPLLDRARRTELRVRSGDLTASVNITLAQGVGMQASVGPRLLGRWHYGSGLGSGAAIDWHLGVPLGHNTLWLGLSTSVERSAPARFQTSGQRQLRGLTRMSMLLEARYALQLHPRLRLHVGAGLGPLFAAPVWDVQGRTLDAGLVPALEGQGLVGLGIPLADGELGLDLRAGYAWPLTPTADLGSLSGVGLSLGYRFFF